jgi:hypothetical protein
MAKGMSIFLGLTLGLMMSNKILFELRPNKTYIHKTLVNFSQLGKTNKKLIMVYHDIITGKDMKHTFDLNNVVFINNSRSASNIKRAGTILLEIPYETKSLPENLQLWFTLPNLWIHKYNKSEYKPYLGKIKVYSKNIQSV